MSHEQQPPVILDCTIRDGNYAVDFKFTESDTQLLVNQLANLGIKWLEVGHGLGLGACESGEHSMPSDDLSMIRSAKAACRGAKIGAFFLPGAVLSPQTNILFHPVKRRQVRIRRAHHNLYTSFCCCLLCCRKQGLCLPQRCRVHLPIGNNNWFFHRFIFLPRTPSQTRWYGASWQ